MKEIVINHDQVKAEIDYLKIVLNLRSSMTEPSTMIPVHFRAVEHSIQCMERLIEVYEVSAKELASIDDPENELQAAYEEWKLVSRIEE